MEQVNKLLERALRGNQMPDKFFMLENKLELLKIPFDHIFYFEKIKGTHNICIVYIDGVSTFKSDLRDVLQKLDSNFIQCHKSYIAFIPNIMRIEKFPTYLTLHFAEAINCPCSMLYKNEVLKQWKS